jgi:hypothetical protein
MDFSVANGQTLCSMKISKLSIFAVTFPMLLKTIWTPCLRMSKKEKI